ncbi:DNA ligase 1-like isoform X3 [Haliotis rufescens]|uniref:DNA ligase 1-like isoform X2 n=1 Tax=Haliotis rufescens TaxID=6454 RepID=UPI001EB068E0|nr:DNA ligase 1-like isoform X2 [Haliotis rufescens]XP_048250120.1 DNA ligase 1-like isoform X3 [Haliotis rufescens]
MVPKFALVLVLLPLALAWPMEVKDDEKEMMMKYMMATEGKEDNKDMMMKYMMATEGKEDNKDMMMKYMMKKMAEEKKEHYAGDADGCKADDDAEWKVWVKKQQEEKAEKMKEEYKKFKEFMAHKKMMEEKKMEEKKEQMYEMWQKQKEMKEREEKEGEFKEMIESFQSQKHKFAFQLTHEFLQLCQCNEVSEQMEKLSMFTIRNGTDLMDNMTSSNVSMSMETGDMAMLAQKMSKMSAEEKKKVFMAGLIKSMCNGAQTFIRHAKQFEEMYVVKYTDDKEPTTTKDPFTSD